jgi:adenylate cyclase class IV
MEEFKIAYNHNKALAILQKLGAEFVGKEILEDLYLIDDGQNIWKLSRTNEQIQLVHLKSFGNKFVMTLEKKIEKEKVSKELNQLFDISKEKMQKKRKHYMLGKSEIVLDNIENLGQFIELYPANSQEKEKIFKSFHIRSAELITKSYNALRTQK